MLKGRGSIWELKYARELGCRIGHNGKRHCCFRDFESLVREDEGDDAGAGASAGRW